MDNSTAAESADATKVQPAVPSNPPVVKKTHLEPKSEIVGDLLEAAHGTNHLTKTPGYLNEDSEGSLAYFKKHEVTVDAGWIPFGTTPNRSNEYPCIYMKNEDGDVMRYDSKNGTVKPLTVIYPCVVAGTGLKEQEYGHFKSGASKENEADKAEGENPGEKKTYNADSLKKGTVTLLLRNLSMDDFQKYINAAEDEEDKQERIMLAKSFVAESSGIYDMALGAATKFRRDIGCKDPAFTQPGSKFYDAVFSNPEIMLERELTLPEREKAMKQEGVTAKSKARRSACLMRIGEYQPLDSEKKGPLLDEDGNPVAPIKQFNTRRHLSSEIKTPGKNGSPSLSRIEEINTGYTNPCWDPHDIGIVELLPKNHLYTPLPIEGPGSNQPIYPCDYSKITNGTICIASLTIQTSVTESGESKGSVDLKLNPQKITCLDVNCYVNYVKVLSVPDKSQAEQTMPIQDVEEEARLIREAKAAKRAAKKAISSATEEDVTDDETAMDGAASQEKSKSGVDEEKEESGQASREEKESGQAKRKDKEEHSKNKKSKSAH